MAEATTIRITIIQKWLLTINPSHIVVQSLPFIAHWRKTAHRELKAVKDVLVTQ